MRKYEPQPEIVKPQTEKPKAADPKPSIFNRRIASAKPNRVVNLAKI